MDENKDRLAAHNGNGLKISLAKHAQVPQENAHETKDKDNQTTVREIPDSNESLPKHASGESGSMQRERTEELKIALMRALVASAAVITLVVAMTWLQVSTLLRDSEL